MNNTMASLSVVLSRVGEDDFSREFKKKKNFDCYRGSILTNSTNLSSNPIIC